MKSIIFIHGNASSSKVFEPIIKNWQLPVNLIALDLPGHGNSEKKTNYSWNSNKSSLLDDINKIEGDKLLLGNSLGGFYAVELAQKVKSLKGVVLMGSTPLKKPINFNEAFVPNPYVGAYLKNSPDKEEIHEAAYAAVENKSIVPLLIEDFYKTETKARTVLVDCLANPDVFLDQAKIFSLLRCSKYIITGKKDPIINFDYLKKLQKEAVHPIKLLEIKNCGHYPSIEKPKEFAKILEKISDEVFQ